jgi:hypothetical protein
MQCYIPSLILTQLALDAQERKCRLNPSSVPVSSGILSPGKFIVLSLSYPTNIASATRRPSTPEISKASSSHLDSSPQFKAAQNEIKSLKAQLATSKLTAKRKESPGAASKVIQGMRKLKLKVGLRL